MPSTSKRTTVPCRDPVAARAVEAMAGVVEDEKVVGRERLYRRCQIVLETGARSLAVAQQRKTQAIRRVDSLQNVSERLGVISRVTIDRRCGGAFSPTTGGDRIAPSPSSGNDNRFQLRGKIHHGLHSQLGPQADA